MPKSKPPRHARGVPQYQRDLQRTDKPMPTQTAVKARGALKAHGRLAGTAAVSGLAGAAWGTKRGVRAGYNAGVDEDPETRAAVRSERVGKGVASFVGRSLAEDASNAVGMARDAKSALKSNKTWSALGVGQPKTKLDVGTDVGLIGASLYGGNKLSQQKRENKTLRSAIGVSKGLISIPLSQTSRGGAAGIKRLKGAAEEAAQATWKNKIGQSSGRMAKAYAPTTPYEGALRLRRTLMQSKESGQRAKVAPFKAGMHGGDVPARGPMSEFNFGAGVKAHHSMMRQRGVSKADNVMTGTNVRRLTPRTPTGRFVSHENDLVYIQPRAFIGKRPPRDSRLQVWHKGKVAKGASFGDAKRFMKEGKRPIGRAEKERAAQASSPSLADTSRHTGARHGKRLA